MSGTCLSFGSFSCRMMIKTFTSQGRGKIEKLSYAKCSTNLDFCGKSDLSLLLIWLLRGRGIAKMNFWWCVLNYKVRNSQSHKRQASNRQREGLGLHSAGLGMTKYLLEKDRQKVTGKKDNNRQFFWEVVWQSISPSPYLGTKSILGCH